MLDISSREDSFYILKYIMNLTHLCPRSITLQLKTQAVDITAAA